MRTSLASAALLVLALPVALGGCGDRAGSSAHDPAGASSGRSAGSPSAAASGSAAPVSSRATCRDLYRPPHQLAPRALDLVHGDSGHPGRHDAAQLADDLGSTAGTALPDLAADIVVMRDGMTAVARGADPDTAAFDRSANRLARRCALYAD
jgi:hypothetical protein